MIPTAQDTQSAQKEILDQRECEKNSRIEELVNESLKAFAHLLPYYLSINRRNFTAFQFREDGSEKGNFDRRVANRIIEAFVSKGYKAVIYRVNHERAPSNTCQVIVSW